MELATSSSSSVVGSDIRRIFSSKKTKDLYPHGVWDKCAHLCSPSPLRSLKMVASATKMASNVYRGRNSSIGLNNKMYTKLDSCLVVSPTPNRGKPRAIIKFLGGAFIGAVPEFTYGYYVLPICFLMHSVIFYIVSIIFNFVV